MTKSFKLVAAAALSLSVAGTCLAAPALAATPSGLGSALDAVAQAAEGGADAAQPEQDTLVSLGTHCNFAGLAFDVPQGFEAEQSDDATMLSMSNASGTTALLVYDLRDAQLPEGYGWDDYFAQIAQGSVADYADATVEDLGASEDDDGVDIEGHAFGLAVTDGDDAYVMVQLFVPMPEGGFSLFQIGYSANEASEDEVDELTDILDSIEFSGDDKVDIDDLQTSACGLTFELPDGVSPYDGDENAWMDADGSILIKAVGGVVEGASKLTDDDYDELFGLLEPEGEDDGAKVELIASGVEPGVDVDVHYASYSVQEADGTMYCAVMLAPAADDTLSVVIAWCSDEGAADYGEAITAMMGTFEQE